MTPDPQPDRGERRDDLLEMLEVWAKWIGDDCAVGMEDTNRQLCAIDIRKAATQIEHLQARVEEVERERDYERLCHGSANLLSGRTGQAHSKKLRSRRK